MIKYLLPTTLIFTLFNNTLYNSKSILITIIATVLILFFTLLTRRTLNYKLIAIILLFIGLSWISYFTSSTGNLGLYEITLDSTLWILFLFLIHHNFSKANKSYFYFIYTLIGLGIIQSIFGISQVFTREETRIAGSFLSWHNHREFFPNALGLFFVLTIPFIYLIKKHWLFSLILALNSTALLLTFSRGALIVFLIQTLSIIVYLIYHKQQKKVLALFISLIIAFTSFSALNNYKNSLFPEVETTNLSEKYTFSGTERITSLSERQQFFIGSTKLIQQKPLTGFGPNSFSYVYPQVQPLFLANAPHPHNWILKIGVERGLLTLIPFLSIFLLLIFNTYKQPLKITLEPINLLSYLALTGGFLHNMIDFNFNFVSNYLIYIVILAYLFSLNSNNKTKSSKTYINLFLIGIILLASISWTFKEITFHNAKNNYQNNPEISQQLLTDLNYKNSYQLLADLKNNDQERIEICLNQVQINPFDAKAFNHLGNLHQNQNEKAYYYHKAIKADPKNNWIYYYNYFSHTSNENILKNEKPILILLSQYLELAKLNIHFTAQHDNIIQAQNIAQVFYENTQNKEFQEIKQDLIIAQETFRR